MQRQVAAAQAVADEAGRAVAESTAACQAMVRSVDERGASIPSYVREKPPWWAFWAWIARWFAMARYRTVLAEIDTARARVATFDEARLAAERASTTAQQALGEKIAWVATVANAGAAQERKRAALEEGRSRIEREIVEIDEIWRASRPSSPPTTPSAAPASRAACAPSPMRACGGGRRQTMIVEIPSLPVGAAVFEQVIHGDWARVTTEADGCVLVGAEQLPPPALLLFGRASPAAAGERTRGADRRARAAPARPPSGLGGAAHRARGAGSGPEPHRPPAGAAPAGGARAARRVRARRRGAHRRPAWVRPGRRRRDPEARDLIERETERLNEQWIASVVAARSKDALKATLATVDKDARAGLTAVREQARGIFAAAIVAAANDLLPRLLENITSRQFAPAEEPAAAFEPFPSWDIKASIAPSISWFAARLRSFDSVHEECVNGLRGRLGVLRQRAMANLLEIEPKVHELLRDTLRATIPRVSPARSPASPRPKEARREAATRIGAEHAQLSAGPGAPRRSASRRRSGDRDGAESAGARTRHP